MIEFGATLRRAREAKGLTPAQLAQTTHLMAQQIDDLENENFSRIAAPIYGRGFVKLYCEAVGLDPKPMIAEFMEIFNGNRPPVIRTRGSASPVMPPPPAPMPEPQPEPMPEPEPAPMPEPEPQPEEAPAADPDAFTLESDYVHLPPARPEPTPAQTPVAESLFDAPTDELPLEPQPETPVRQRPSRFFRPQPIDDEKPRFSFPAFFEPLTRAKRLIILAVGALLLLWLLVLACRALYRASMGTPADNGTTASETSAVSADRNANARPMRGIPAIYLD